MTKDPQGGPLGAKGYSRYLQVGPALPSHSPGLGRVLPAGRYKKRPALRSSLDWSGSLEPGGGGAQGSLGPAHTPHQVGTLPDQRAEGVERRSSEEGAHRGRRTQGREAQRRGSEGRGQKGGSVHREETQSTIQLRCVRGVEGPRAGEENACWKCQGPISLSLTVPRQVREGGLLLVP